MVFALPEKAGLEARWLKERRFSTADENQM
jgi:hypothetical protein